MGVRGSGGPAPDPHDSTDARVTESIDKPLGKAGYETCPALAETDAHELEAQIRLTERSESERPRGVVEHERAARHEGGWSHEIQ